MPHRSPRRAARLRPPSYEDCAPRAPESKASREAILEEIAREEARIAELERAIEVSRSRLQRLHETLKAAAGPSPDVKVPRTPAEKIGLFRSLFRGREDVFPVRFVSRKTGKAGYAPQCSNKWEPACILKKGGRCSDCPNQAFVPITDRVIADHLQGRIVMGIYPLLQDDTCWFLAVDFDDRSWKEDVIAFVETCRSHAIPVAIERSRSGNGAHAWFFFSEPVPASLARQMGSYLITETTNRRHELSLSSYDRLFPNQDTMPRGGFGNLIALPLQYDARQHDNSVFVDDRFVPYSDQWAFLASIRRMSLKDVEALAGEGMRRSHGVGVRFLDEDAPAPWNEPPSRRNALPRYEGPLPAQIKGVLAQRLFIEKAGLPSPMLNRTKRIAAFQNPEFYKRQKMRLSTAGVPRVICCAEDFEAHIALPRGCVEEVRELLADHEVELVIDDQRTDGVAVECEFRGELSPVQEEAARALLAQIPASSLGRPGSAKPCLEPISSRAGRGIRSSSFIESRFSSSGLPSSRCFSASTKRTSVRSVAVSANRTASSTSR